MLKKIILFLLTGIAVLYLPVAISKNKTVNLFIPQPFETMKLNQSTFWEYDVAKMDPEKSFHTIIPRIAMRGTLDEFREMRRFYGDEKIKEVLLQTRYLDKRTLHFISNLYDIPKEEFRCFKLRQSLPPLWDY